MSEQFDSSFLPSLKSSKVPRFKSGSYLDDDSLEIVKAPKASNRFDALPSKSVKSKTKSNSKNSKPITKNQTVVDKLYNSLKNSTRESRDSPENNRMEGPKVSINVGAQYGPESSEVGEEPQPQNLNTFDIASGSINHGNRSV